MAKMKIPTCGTSLLRNFNLSRRHFVGKYDGRSSTRFHAFRSFGDRCSVRIGINQPRLDGLAQPIRSAGQAARLQTCCYL
jgi:hypothetical protein